MTGGLTAIVGIIVNYIKDDDVSGTWLQSHFDWQKSTSGGGYYGSLSVVTHIILIGYAIMFVLTFWLIYRIAGLDLPGRWQGNVF